LQAGIFWEFQWYDHTDEPASYYEVRRFYKKLKKYDKSNNTSKAERFLQLSETGIAVPYQQLREYAKNHHNTTQLIDKYKDNDVYLSIVDDDTVSFNGIFSAYIQIHDESQKNGKGVPTLMSTGYEITEERAGDYPIVEGCKLDRMIRIATAKHLPLSVYYPEPNFCVLVRSVADLRKESFINTNKTTDDESVGFIKNILKSRESDGTKIVAIFSEYNPLITAIPRRFRYYKKSPEKLIINEFSERFKQRQQPTYYDLYLFKQFSQSHVDLWEWITNLYRNVGIQVKFEGGSGSHREFVG
jgi:hypothetical protein